VACSSDAALLYEVVLSLENLVYRQQLLDIITRKALKKPIFGTARLGYLRIYGNAIFKEKFFALT
jgi:hypothetical protein